MKKRDFLKIFSVGTVSAIALSSVAWSCMGADRKKGLKNWAWIHPVESSDPAHSCDAWKKLLTNLNPTCSYPDKKNWFSMN